MNYQSGEGRVRPWMVQSLDRSSLRQCGSGEASSSCCDDELTLLNAFLLRSASCSGQVRLISPTSSNGGAEFCSRDARMYKWCIFSVAREFIAGTSGSFQRKIIRETIIGTVGGGVQRSGGKLRQRSRCRVRGFGKDRDKNIVDLVEMGRRALLCAEEKHARSGGTDPARSKWLGLFA